MEVRLLYDEMPKILRGRRRRQRDESYRTRREADEALTTKPRSLKKTCRRDVEAAGQADLAVTRRRDLTATQDDGLATSTYYSTATTSPLSSTLEPTIPSSVDHSPQG